MSAVAGVAAFDFYGGSVLLGLSCVGIVVWLRSFSE